MGTARVSTNRFTPGVSPCVETSSRLSSQYLCSELSSSRHRRRLSALPGKITSVTARPGPLVGQVTLSWKTTGSHTTGFRLETALTSFSKTDKSMLRSGRYSRLTSIAKNKRSITLSATKVTQLGAGVASGNHLYYRFYALDTVNGKTTVRAYPYLQAVLPKAAGPKAKGTKLRVASFNVPDGTSHHRHAVMAAPGTRRGAEIKAHNPGVVALQELGPGRADGKSGTTDGTARQTTSLTAALDPANAGNYKLVRSTPYSPAGAATATQRHADSMTPRATRCSAAVPETTG